MSKDGGTPFRLFCFWRRDYEDALQKEILQVAKGQDVLNAVLPLCSGKVMAREFAKMFYRSAAWKKCRASYISQRAAIDGGMCEYCKEQPGYIVDHIEELNPLNINDPTVSLNHDNLQYLCLDCHNTKTFAAGARYILTANGEVVPLPPLEIGAVSAEKTGAPTSGEYAGRVRGGCS